MTALDWFALLLVGLATGLLGGLTGIGGSIVMIPALTELRGPDQHLYQAAAMIVNFFVVIPAVYQHARARAIHWPMVCWTLPVALFAVVGGVACSELPLFARDGQLYLSALFGLFLIYVAAYQVYDMVRPRPARAGEIASSPSQSPVTRGFLIGLPSGFLGGLLGIGGGVVAVPIQIRGLKIPLRNAIANSAFTIIGVSFVGAIVKNYGLVTHQGHSLGKSLTLAAVLIPTAFLGSLLGSRLTHTLPLRTVQLVFIAILIIGGVRMTAPVW